MLYVGAFCITQQCLAICRTAHGRIVNIMAMSVGDEFDTYESFKSKA